MTSDNTRVNQLADSILDCNDLLELGLIMWNQAYRLRTKKRNRIYEDLYSLLLEKAPTGNGFYTIAENKEWIAPYLLHMWHPFDNVMENSVCWFQIRDEIKTNYVPGQSPQITAQQVDRVMEHIEERYGLCSKLLSGNPVDILLIPNSHKEHNSQYGLKVDTSLPKSEVIIMLNCTNEGHSPEALLLHELGHVLHTRLTGKQWVPPKSFDFLQQKMYRALDKDPKSDWCEYFADAFAVAALQDSPFPPNEYMSMYWEDDKAAISEYFRLLMETAGQNPGNDYTWEELQSMSL